MIRLMQGDCLERMQGLADCSVDSIVTDPPYGLSDHSEKDVVACMAAWLSGRPFVTGKKGFMGKTWDSWVPGPEVWRECYRVLKPGAYMIVFASTRTDDLMSMACRLAGFRKHPAGVWCFGSGFPKAANLSKALDKIGGVSASGIDFKKALACAVSVSGISRKQIDAECGFTMRYDTPYDKDPKGWGCSFPGITQWAKIKEVVPVSDIWDAFVHGVDREIVRSGIPKGKSNGIYGDFATEEYNYTSSTTDAAKQHDGWYYGLQSLKPAIEPWLMFQKPHEGSMTDNVLKHGTGAINIDGCRVSGEPPHHNYGRTSGEKAFAGASDTPFNTPDSGRWPANLIHDGSECVTAMFPDTKSGSLSPDMNIKESTGWSGGSQADRVKNTFTANSGSAARFFYCAKASKSDREEGMEEAEDKFMAASNQAQAELKRGNIHQGESGVNTVKIRKNNHPTVKPVALMQYLCRLVTPPGGIVLDPFMGSGSTGKAAIAEGFRFIGCEMDSGYLEIAKARIDHALLKSLDDLI